jgi:hypothetical protein
MSFLRSKLALAAVALILAALAGWSYSWWTNVRIETAWSRPDHRLEIPIRLVAGEEFSKEFVPNVDMPHQVHLEIRTDPLEGTLMPLLGEYWGPEDPASSLIDVPWSVTREDTVAAEGVGTGHHGRVNIDDWAIAWLGSFDADDGERYVVRVRVGRTVPQLAGADVRLVVVRNDLHLKDAAITSDLVSVAAFVPCALGLALLLVLFLNRPRPAVPRRRPGHSL